MISRRTPRILLAKPGLDGHDRGAKVVAHALKDAGFEVIYTGLHQTVEMIVLAAIQEDADIIGLSVMSGAHIPICQKLMSLLKEKGAEDIMVLIGGVIPARDVHDPEGIGSGRSLSGGDRYRRACRFYKRVFQRKSKLAFGDFGEVNQMNEPPAVYKPSNHIRLVTAASLFDGHDAAINIMRRILQASGAEVIHLGHNRSVSEIVTAAIQEDVQGIGVSCYQGGHIEYFKYIVDLLRKYDAEHIKVFGGGGGVIVPEEIRELEAYGVSRIYSPEDGRKYGLQGIINDFIERCDFPTWDGDLDGKLARLDTRNWKSIAGAITAVEIAKESGDGDLPSIRAQLEQKIGDRKSPFWVSPGREARANHLLPTK